jgi:WASH complex subunit strumpellin
MEKTLMGIIEVDPKKLLEDGIRKELVNQIASALDDILNFKNHNIDVFENKLRQLSSKLQGMFRSFECENSFLCTYTLNRYSRLC